MLPANPLQHLLLQELQCPLVMTSGNLSGKPPAISNEQALADLQGIADGFLIHNRDIVQRMDDSVVRESGEMLRRSRGYVPDALALPPGFKNVPPVLCLGADLKNTFCLVRGEQAVLSQHLGDLSDDGIQMQWREALRLMQNIYDFTPQYVVHDVQSGLCLQPVGERNEYADANGAASSCPRSGVSGRASVAAGWRGCHCFDARWYRYGGERRFVGRRVSAGELSRM